MAGEFERELLFGLLALQQGLLHSDQLLSAVRLRLTDESRPLRQILVEQAALSSATAEGLAPLVAEQIAAHGDDPLRCLAALDVDSHVANFLRAASDARLDELLGTLVPASGAAPTGAPPAQAAPLPATGSRFRVLRTHAKGGLGEVYVAHDGELHRNVALKEIQACYVRDRESRARFVLEAEITGGLEHPGVVPVYGLGHYSDGRPYYAMRFIQGDSLREAIERFHAQAELGLAETDRNLELRQLLKRFVDVCQTIAYAHSRGVLHRDLKPGNIMLGKYGETLVVDWGLAKVRGRSEPTAPGEQTLRPASGSGITQTQQGSALGTPAYMPPEQAAGALDQLGPASDVYSLGATLYHLLTGRAPFAGKDVAAILHGVRTGDFARPRSVRPEIPPPLEAICLRAMALRPDDRYATPQLLAAEIERFLADEPVAAHREPLLARARRWARKHPTLTATTAAVVLLSTVGLGAFSFVLEGKNDALRDALDRESQARALAQRNEAAARQQSLLALSTLTAVTFDIQAGLRNLTGGEEVRRGLLKTALDGLDRVTTQYVDQTYVDQNTWGALIELGDIVLQFGGDSTEAQYALPDGADAAPPPRLAEDRSDALPVAQTLFTRALAMAEQLAAAQPGDAQLQDNVAISLNRLGSVYAMRGESEQALALYARAGEISRRQAAESPDDLELQRSWSISLDILGDAQLEAGDTDEARRLYEEALVIDRRRAAAAADDVAAQHDLSTSLSKLGDVCLETGDFDGAEDYYRQALEIDKRLAEEAPGNSELRHGLAVGYERLGKLARRRGNLPRAKRLYEQAREIRAEQAAAAPSDNALQRRLASLLSKLGDVCRDLDDVADARGYYEQSRDAYRRQYEQNPQDYYMQQGLAYVLVELAGLYLQEGDAAAAQELYREALVFNRQFVADDPADGETRRSLSLTLTRLGDACLKLEDAAGARALYEEALAIDRALAEAAPTDLDAQHDLAISLNRLGDVNYQEGQLDVAADYYRQYLALAEALAPAAPNDVLFQRDLTVAHYALGEVYSAQEDYAAALAEYEQALHNAQQMLEREQDVAQSEQDVGVLSRRIERMQGLLQPQDE